MSQIKYVIQTDKFNEFFIFRSREANYRLEQQGFDAYFKTVDEAKHHIKLIIQGKINRLKQNAKNIHVVK